jgi:N-(2-amino-2-carboxyethyl)-L-glutamate synthase
MIYDSVVACIGGTPLVSLKRLFSRSDLHIMAKLEFLNPGGSVKDRSARFIIEKGLQNGTITPSTHLIESTSGNLGIALAMMAKVYALAITCVIDPNISPTNLQILRQFNANIIMVHEQDDGGGYLHTRIRCVHNLLQTIPNSYWVNQYANDLNWQAHYYGTGSEIATDVDAPIDCLVVAVSTTGTLRGINSRLREEFPHLRTIAVDAIGSVIFGAPGGPRGIPGIGASRVPELLKTDDIDEVIYVSDEEAVQGCRELLLKEGIFAGGSSGSVVAALKKLLPTFPLHYRVVTIFPDRGDRYLETVYNDGWSGDLSHAQSLSTRSQWMRSLDTQVNRH